MFTVKRLGLTAALFAVAGMTIAFAGSQPRPFAGSGTGVAVDGMFTGSGNATHLGTFTFSKAIATATDNGDGTVTMTGVAAIRAANGDILHGSFDLTIDFTTEPSIGTGVLTWDSNGTGRFDDASGNIDIVTMSTSTGGFAFSGEGTIIY